MPMSTFTFTFTFTAISRALCSWPLKNTSYGHSLKKELMVARPSL